MVIGMYFRFGKITATEVAILEAIQIFIITGLKIIKYLLPPTSEKIKK
jgi:hypothetical protein